MQIDKCNTVSKLSQGQESHNWSGLVVHTGSPPSTWE